MMAPTYSNVLLVEVVGLVGLGLDIFGRCWARA